MEKTIVSKKKLVEYFLQKNILVTPDILESIDKINSIGDFYNLLRKNISTDDFLSIK